MAFTRDCLGKAVVLMDQLFQCRPEMLTESEARNWSTTLLRLASKMIDDESPVYEPQSFRKCKNELEVFQVAKQNLVHYQQVDEFWFQVMGNWKPASEHENLSKDRFVVRKELSAWEFRIAQALDWNFSAWSHFNWLLIYLDVRKNFEVTQQLMFNDSPLFYLLCDLDIILFHASVMRYAPSISTAALISIHFPDAELFIGDSIRSDFDQCVGQIQLLRDQFRDCLTTQLYTLQLEVFHDNGGFKTLQCYLSDVNKAVLSNIASKNRKRKLSLCERVKIIEDKEPQVSTRHSELAVQC